MNKKNKKDKCLSCKKETQYDEFEHIDFRNFYIEAVGQLCPECHNELYGDPWKNTYLYESQQDQYYSSSIQRH